MQDRLTISFWIWALWDTGTNGFFNDLELRMAELVERGFNCIRVEAGLPTRATVKAARLLAHSHRKSSMDPTVDHHSLTIATRKRGLASAKRNSHNPKFRSSRAVKANPFRRNTACRMTAPQ